MNQINSIPEITVYGADWCPDCRRAKRLLDERKVWHGSKKLKKWTQDLYKLCNKVLSDSNKAIPAERVV